MLHFSCSDERYWYNHYASDEERANFELECEDECAECDCNCVSECKCEDDYFDGLSAEELEFFISSCRSAGLYYEGDGIYFEGV